MIKRTFKISICKFIYFFSSFSSSCSAHVIYGPSNGFIVSKKKVFSLFSLILSFEMRSDVNMIMQNDTRDRILIANIMKTIDHRLGSNSYSLYCVL